MRYFFIVFVASCSTPLFAQWQTESSLSLFTINPPSRVLTLHLSYGFASPNIDDALTDFSRGSAFEGTIGIKRFLDSDYSPSQLDYAHIFLTTSYISSSRSILTDTLQTQSELPNLIGVSMFRFGFGSRDGLGYKIQKAGVITPFISSTQFLTTVSTSSDSLTTRNDPRLGRYKGGLHYATSTESGIMIDAGNVFALDLSFENAIVQPRWIALQSLSNLLLQQLAHILLRQVIDFLSPDALNPVIGFGVKTAFNFWLYSQKAKQANFPFQSEPGLSILMFKASISFAVD